MTLLSSLVIWASLSGSVAATGDIVLLDFTADWCGPCKSMEPAIGRLASAGYPVRKVNIDHEPALARQFQVRSIPCFILVKDGQVIDRVVGATSYDRLVQAFQKAGDLAQTAPAANLVPTSGRLSPPAGHTASPFSPPADFPPPAEHPAMNPPAERAPVNRTAPPQTLSRSLPPQHHSAPPAEHTVAGQTGASEAEVMKAAVRLQIQDQDGNSYGTGTIIDVHGSEALVLTCGHVFRDSQGKGKIDVDLFVNGQTLTVPGRLIVFDLKRDVALVSIRPGAPVTPAAVASAQEMPREGDAVFSIGCDKGADPSIRRSRISALNKYLGPPNIEVAGQPVDGRSGGGLFNTQGKLIGVCNAADPADNEGIYAALASVHWQLDQIGQQRIYGGAAPPEHQLVSHEIPQRANPAPPVTPVAPASPPAETSQGFGDAEVICIVRQKGGQNVMVIEQPSPALMQQLTQEYRQSSTEAGPDRVMRGQY